MSKVEPYRLTMKPSGVRYRFFGRKDIRKAIIEQVGAPHNQE
jgi:hypothetical protein